MDRWGVIYSPFFCDHVPNLRGAKEELIHQYKMPLD